MNINTRSIKNNVCVLLWFCILQITTFIITPYSGDLLFSCITNKSDIFVMVLTEILLSLLLWAAYVVLFNVFFIRNLMTKFHFRFILLAYVCNQLVFKCLKLLLYNCFNNYYVLFWIVDIISVVSIQIGLIVIFRDLMPAAHYKKPRVYILITAAVSLAVIGIIILLSDNNTENSRVFLRYILLMIIMIFFQFFFFMLLQQVFSANISGKMIILTIIWSIFVMLCCGIKTFFPFGMLSNKIIHKEYNEKIHKNKFYVDETTTRIYRSYGTENKEVFFCQELEIYYGKDKIYSLKEYNAIGRNDIIIKDDKENKTLEIKQRIKITADKNGKWSCVEL